MPNRRRNKNMRNAKQAISDCKRFHKYLVDFKKELAASRSSIRELNVEIYNLKPSAHQPAQQKPKAKKWWQFSLTRMIG